MRKWILVFLASSVASAFAQTTQVETKWKQEQLGDSDLYQKEYREQFIKDDFSPIWTHTPNYNVMGLIGPHYQRLRIKFISVSKDKEHPASYSITGRSMVKDNKCDFRGSLLITSIRLFKNMHWGVDDEFKNSGIKYEGILLGTYAFAENKSEKYSGVFQGVFCSRWFEDHHGAILCDTIEYYSDNFCNNQFVGTWRSYGGTHSEVCNWGDDRIPLSGNLDEGAGEFSPQDKYLKYGWQGYRKLESQSASTTFKRVNRAREKWEKDGEWWKQ